MTAGDYGLLKAFRSLFDSAPYFHRDSSLGDRVASYLYEDLYNLNKSAKLRERIDGRVRVLNTQNLTVGIARRRGDGTFGELVPAAIAITAQGFAVARGPVATIEIGVETKILAKAMIKQIDRVIGDLIRQTDEFKMRGGNPKKLYKFGEVDERIKALGMWVDSGFELGNHTYSHSSLNRVGLQAWEDDVIQGESVTRLLLAQHNMKLRYFRHPYLDTGRDLETRRQAEAFLVGRGYHIAPVTLDAWDWMYGGVYEDAKKRADVMLQQQLVKSYLEYTDAVFAYSEQLSKEIIGYEPKQILLLHGNQLEADHFNELAEVIRKRGYRFITLEDALSDQAYSLPDTFVGEEGTGWLEHWAITRGKPPQGAPEFPAWVIEKSRAIQKPPP